MKVLLVQMDIAWEARETNFATVRRLLAQTAPDPETMIILPEMFATGFSMNREAVDTAEGPILAFMREEAKRWSACLVGGLAVFHGADAGNLAAAFGPKGDALAYYVKQRPFRPGGEVYSPGIEPTVFSWQGAQVSPFICYDLRFPELFREAARRWRPEVYVVIASWPEARIHHWIRLLQARAIENQAFVIGVNRIGVDPHFYYPGRSLVVDWDGEVRLDTGGEEGCHATVLDLVGLREYRQRLPFLGDLK